MGREPRRQPRGINTNYYERRRVSKAAASQSYIKRRIKRDSRRVPKKQWFELEPEFKLKEMPEEVTLPDYGPRYITYPIYTRRTSDGQRISEPRMESAQAVWNLLREQGLNRLTTLTFTSAGTSDNLPALRDNFICPRCHRDVRLYEPCVPDRYIPMTLDPDTVVDADP